MPYRSYLPIFAFWLVIINVSAGFSQGNSFEFPFIQKVSFVPYPDSEERITNDLLQHIAEGSGRLRSLVSYNISGRMALNLAPGQNGKLAGNIKLENLSVNGDMHYRDFSIGRVLIPDLLSFEVNVKGSNGRIIYNERLSKIQLGEPGAILHRFELPRPNGNGTYQPEISKIHFSYSEAAYERLDKWFGYLEEYYRAGAELSALKKETSEIRFSDPTRLILEEFSLCEAERRMELIARMSFMKGFDAAAGDPEGVFSTYNEVKSHIENLRNDFNRRMIVIDSLLYESGLEYLQAGETSVARQRFENALVLNPIHVPSHLALAKLDLARGNKNESIKRLGDVFSFMFPYGEWRQKAYEIADSVMSRFFSEAFNLNREGRFKESLDLLAPLEEFCEKTQGFFDCPAELAFRLNQAHMGMYRSFLVVGNRALRNNNLNLCRIYTGSAVEYQQNNTRFVPDASEAYDLLQQVVNRYLELAAGQFSSGEYLKAADNYLAASDLCSQFTELFCAPNVQRRQQLALEMHERRGAAAETVSSSGTMLPEPEPLNLPPLMGQPREDMLERVRFGQLQAWAGNLNAAREVQAEANTMSQRFRLGGDQLITNEIKKLDQQIREKECELAAREFESLVNRGVNFRKYGEIILAAEAGQNAGVLLNAHPDCNFFPDERFNELLRLKTAAIYIEMVEEAWLSYRASIGGDFKETLEKYHLAENFFRKNNPEGFDAANYIMAAFITQSGNVEFLKAAISFMTDHAADYEHEIIELLFVTKNSGVSRNEARSVQYLAGRKLATHFHSKMPGQKPEHLVRSLTGRDPWFRFFEQAFVRNWGVY